MTKAVFLSIVFLFTGCADFKDLPGNYYVHKSPDVKLILEEDSTFQLYNAQTNPYLLPFEHPDEYFWMTKGNWKIDEGTVLLTSDSMTTVDSNADLLFQKNLDYRGIELVTLNYRGDTVPILQVKVHDSLTIARFHRSMSFFKFDFQDWPTDNEKFRPPQKGDILEFSFYGYAPLQVPFNQIINKLTVYQLNMAFNHQAFNSHRLKVGNKKLKDKLYNLKLEKEKTAGNKK